MEKIIGILVRQLGRMVIVWGILFGVLNVITGGTFFEGFPYGAFVGFFLYAVIMACGFATYGR